jgi:hypothetical protein
MWKDGFHPHLTSPSRGEECGRMCFTLTLVLSLKGEANKEGARQVNFKTLILLKLRFRFRLKAGMTKHLEATSGFEPLNRGFADPCLNHLATSPVINFTPHPLFSLSPSP